VLVIDHANSIHRFISIVDQGGRILKPINSLTSNPTMMKKEGV